MRVSRVSSFSLAVLTRMKVGVFADGSGSESNWTVCCVGDEERCYGCAVPRIQFPGRNNVVTVVALRFSLQFAANCSGGILLHGVLSY